MTNVRLGVLGLNLDRDFTLHGIVNMTGVGGQGQIGSVTPQGEEVRRLAPHGFTIVSTAFQAAQAQDAEVSLTGVRALGQVSNMRGWTVSVTPVTSETAAASGSVGNVRGNAGTDVVRSKIFAAVQMSNRFTTLS